MDSSVGQLERLLEEGASFPFANFSIRDAAQGFQYGGADSPAWLTWKTRAFNTIHALLEEKSAPVALLKGAMDMGTRGNLEDRFVEQKSLMLAAVEQTIRIVQDDAFGESKRPKSISSSSALSNRILLYTATTTPRRPNLRYSSRASALSQWFYTDSRTRVVR